MRYSLLLLAALTVNGAEYYVSPLGSDANAGTYSQPWAASKIFQNKACDTAENTAVAPGDTVWFAAGAYLLAGAACVDVRGTAEAGIVLKAIPGAVVTVTPPKLSKIQVIGTYLDIIGIHFTHAISPRWNNLPGSNPPTRTASILSTVAVGARTPSHIRFINCKVYDTYLGIGSSSSSDQNITSYGTIQFSLGENSPDRLHGGHHYVQNQTGTETYEQLVDVLSVGSFDTQHYGSSSAYLNDVTYKDSIFFNSGGWYIEGGQSTGTANIAVSGNLFAGVKPTFKAGESPGIIDSVITNNYSVDGFSGFAQSSTISGNVTGNGGHNWATISNSLTFATNTTAHSDGYCMGYKSDAESSAFYWVRTYNLWADWLARGYDTDSTCTDDLPAANWVKVVANAHEAGRGNVGIYNWAGATTQSVTVSSFLDDGERWEAIDLWTPLSPAVASGTVSSGAITLPLTGTDVYAPPSTDFGASQCWATDCSQCYTAWKSADSSAGLPAGESLYEPAIITGTNRIWYWSGSAWVDTNASCTPHSVLTYSRIANAHAFLIRRVYDSRAYTTVSWRGTVDGLRAGYLKPNGEYSWELPVINASCTDGLCSARVPQAVGDAWIEIGGTVMKMRAQ
jgi:hypothetical protein